MRYYQLFESQDYYGMFAELPFPPGKNDIETIRKTLKKNDRIVWFLRLYRIGLLNLIARDTIQPKVSARYSKPRYSKLYARYVNEYRRASGQGPGMIIASGLEIIGSVLRWLRRLEHYLSLPIPEIQNYVFKYDIPDEIIKKFADIEKKWQESRQGLIAQNHAEEDASIVLTFPNGYSWWLLDKAYCSREAEAVGHCGNEPRANSSDKILSLRTTKKVGKHLFYVPYCTFILEQDGFLGEMKGKFNNSPKNAFKQGYAPSDFHDEILALLKLPLIEGIRGGGYMPEENFAIKDLPENQQNELGDVKPQMMPLSWQYKKHGATPVLIAMISEELRVYGRAVNIRTRRYDDGNKGFVFDLFKNLTGFIREYVTFNDRSRNGSVAEWCYSVVTGDKHLEIDYHGEKSDKSNLLDLIKHKQPKTYNELVDHIEQLWKEENPDDDPDDYDLLEMIDAVDDERYSNIRNAVNVGMESGAESEVYKAFKRWLDDLEKPGGFWLSLKDDYFESEVKVLIDFPTIIDIIEKEKWDADDLWEVEDISEPHYGFLGYDEEAAVNYLLDNLPSSYKSKD